MDRPQREGTRLILRFSGGYYNGEWGWGQGMGPPAPYTTSRASRGRALPPWTDGSAHHFSAKRRTP